MTPENPAKDQVKRTRESAAVDAAKSAALSATLRHLSHDVDVFQSHAPMSEMYECIWGFCSANKLLVMGTVMIGGVCSVCYDKDFEEHSGNPGKGRGDGGVRFDDQRCSEWLFIAKNATFNQLVMFDDDGGLTPQIDCSFIFVLIGSILICMIQTS